MNTRDRHYNITFSKHGPTRKNRRNWAASEDEQLSSLHATGMTFKRMGELLNRTPSSCNARARMMGLTRDGKRIPPPVIIANAPPTLPYIPGIIVTGRYQMVAP